MPQCELDALQCGRLRPQPRAGLGLSLTRAGDVCWFGLSVIRQ
jgi:hypothetical protein